MDHVHARVREQLVEVGVGRRHLEGAGALVAALGGGAQQAVHLDAEPAQVLDVHGADEPAADDGSADVGEPARSQPSSSPLHPIASPFWSAGHDAPLMLRLSRLDG